MYLIMSITQFNSIKNGEKFMKIRNDLINYLIRLYKIGKTNDLKWREIHGNNMIDNSVDGIFAEQCIKNGKRFDYVKYSIVYKYRTDENFISYPNEGIKYYVLHSVQMNDLKKRFRTPEPKENVNLEDWRALSVNKYGDFRAVFSDEVTAKKAAASLFLHMIYPYQFIMTEEETRIYNKKIERINKRIESCT